MARQMKAEREKPPSCWEADGARRGHRRPKGKQALILTAEGRREAAWRDAEARERTRAEAKHGERVAPS